MVGVNVRLWHNDKLKYDKDKLGTDYIVTLARNRPNIIAGIIADWVVLTLVFNRISRVNKNVHKIMGTEYNMVFINLRKVDLEMAETACFLILVPILPLVNKIKQAKQCATVNFTSTLSV